jgi:Kef-type K+ transport system membrane component KefB
MDELFFLPSWPLQVEDLQWLALLLLAAAIAGEAAQRWLRLPRLLGWIASGVALGPHGAGLIDRDMLADQYWLLEIAIGVVLFELGQRVDLGWLRRNRWLAGTSALESGLAFAFVFAALWLLGAPPLLAATAGAIGIATSPAVVLTLAKDLRAQGQVTERVLLLTALNCIYAVVAVNMLIAWLHAEYLGGWPVVVAHPLYLIFGSAALGGAIAAVLLAALWLLGNRVEAQYICALALVAVAVSLAAALNLSTVLSLIAFGTCARAFDRGHRFVSLEFGRLGRILVILLFALSAAGLELELVPGGLLAGVTLVVARYLGKTLGLLATARVSGLAPRKAGLVSLALMPMSAVAVILVHETSALFPEFGPALATVVVSALAILEVAGPLAARLALGRAGETAEQR